jgi:hypothetical protein
MPRLQVRSIVIQWELTYLKMNSVNSISEQS